MGLTTDDLTTKVTKVALHLLKADNSTDLQL